MKELNLKLSTDEVNTILEALGTQPFVKVYGLIETIQRQAQEQMQGNAPQVNMPAEKPEPVAEEA